MVNDPALYYQIVTNALNLSGLQYFYPNRSRYVPYERFNLSANPSMGQVGFDFEAWNQIIYEDLLKYCTVDIKTSPPMLFGSGTGWQAADGTKVRGWDISGSVRSRSTLWGWVALWGRGRRGPRTNPPPGDDFCIDPDHAATSEHLPQSPKGGSRSSLLSAAFFQPRKKDYDSCSSDQERRTPFLRPGEEDHWSSSPGRRNGDQEHSSFWFAPIYSWLVPARVHEWLALQGIEFCPRLFQYVVDGLAWSISLWILVADLVGAEAMLGPIA